MKVCSSILHVDIWHELLFSDTAKLWNPFEMDRRVVQLRWKQPVASAWLPTKECVTEGGNCEVFSPSICLHLFQDLASNTLLCKFLKFLFLCILEAFVSMSLEAFVYWQHIGMRIDRTCLSRVKIQILIFFFFAFSWKTKVILMHQVWLLPFVSNDTEYLKCSCWIGQKGKSVLFFLNLCLQQ